ncbi:MAG TPA: ABC transporter permease, partial [Terriglobales bacterium]
QELRAEGVDSASAEAALLAELDENLAQELRRAEAGYREPVTWGSTSGSVWRSFTRDLRYGLRSLRKAPGFTAVCVISLALGIGANTAIFQLINAVRLKTLPVRDAQQLVAIHFKQPHSVSGERTGRYSEFSYGQWKTLQQNQQAFQSLAAWGTDSWNLSSGGEVQYAHGMWVSGEFFSMMQQPALRGRTITVADDTPGCATGPVVVSYSFWQQHFGGAADVLGRKLTLNGEPFEVVGVTPADFYGIEVGRVFDIAVPLCTEPLLNKEQPLLPMPHGFWLNITGRLKSGWTLEKASAHVETLSAGIQQQTLPPAYNAQIADAYLKSKLEAASAGNGYSRLRSEYETPLFLLLAVSGIVLLIACANLANLMLARASVREREIAVRLALGASRRRLVLQLMMEGALLAVAGTGLGMALAAGISTGLLRFLSSESTSMYLDRPLDWRVLGFAAVVGALTCVLFALMPSFKATRLAPAQVMNSVGRTTTADRSGFGTRRVLATSQIALSLVLVVAALLFVRTLRNLLETQLGFNEDHVIVANCDFSAANLPDKERAQFYNALLQQIRSIPGVDAAAQTSIIPLSGNQWNDRVLISGARSEDLVYMANISSDYFRTMQIPLLAGRDFGPQDTALSPKVAVVNEAFARAHYQKESAIGKTFEVDVFKGTPGFEYRIVGVIPNTKYGELRESVHPQAYYLLSQVPKPDADVALMIRSQLPLASLRGAITDTVTKANRSIVIDYSVMRSDIKKSLLRERLLAMLSGAFALLAAVLAGVGLYGVIAYIVVRRTNEIGVRMALGAMPSSILRLIVGEAAKMLMSGAVIGIVFALILMKTASSLLYGLKAWDPVTIGLSVAGLAIVTVGASLVPATRAAHMDPMVALREQ